MIEKIPKEKCRRKEINEETIKITEETIMEYLGVSNFSDHCLTLPLGVNQYFDFYN